VCKTLFGGGADDTRRVYRITTIHILVFYQSFVASHNNHRLSHTYTVGDDYNNE
jgi:hypothetical protein